MEKEGPTTHTGSWALRVDDGMSSNTMLNSGTRGVFQLYNPTFSLTTRAYGLLNK